MNKKVWEKQNETIRKWVGAMHDIFYPDRTAEDGSPAILFGGGQPIGKEELGPLGNGAKEHDADFIYLNFNPSHFEAGPTSISVASAIGDGRVAMFMDMQLSICTNGDLMIVKDKCDMLIMFQDGKLVFSGMQPSRFLPDAFESAQTKLRALYEAPRECAPGDETLRAA